MLLTLVLELRNQIKLNYSNYLVSSRAVRNKISKALDLVWMFARGLSLSSMEICQYNLSCPRDPNSVSPSVSRITPMKRNKDLRNWIWTQSMRRKRAEMIQRGLRRSMRNTRTSPPQAFRKQTIKEMFSNNLLISTWERSLFLLTQITVRCQCMRWDR